VILQPTQLPIDPASTLNSTLHVQESAMFDPWIRVHTSLGGRPGPVLPRSLRLTGRVADWESWTRMRFPESGDYVFPAGLAPVHIDRD
jgi:hypothetical protein